VSSEKQNEVRAYLTSGAGGTFYGVDSYDVLMKALAHSKIAGVSGEEFAATLKSHGITPDVVRGAYRLVLPLA
jgi:hypothetical protein